MTDKKPKVKWYIWWCPLIDGRSKLSGTHGYVIVELQARNHDQLSEYSVPIAIREKYFRHRPQGDFANLPWVVEAKRQLLSHLGAAYEKLVQAM